MDTVGVTVKKSNSRIGSIDIAKGLSIFFVCWLHVATNTVPLSLMFLVAYIMGTFFILSAYFYKPNQGYFKNVLKRIRQIIIPMLIYSALVLLLFMLFLVIRGETLEGANSFSNLLIAFKEVFYDSYSLLKIGEFSVAENSYSIIVGAMWFINRLFFSELIFFAIADWTIVSIKRLIPVAFGLIMATFLLQHLVGYHLPFQFEVCFAISAIMLVGAYAKQKNLLNYISTKYKTILYWVIIVVCFGCYLGLAYFEAFGESLFFGVFSKMGGEPWLVFPWFATTLIGSYLFMVACAFLDKIPIFSNIVKWIGRHSIVILCFHLLIGEILLISFNHPNINTILFDLEMTNAYYLNGGSKVARFVIMIATILICCLIAFIIDIIKKGIKNYKNKKINKEELQTEKN